MIQDGKIIGIAVAAKTIEGSKTTYYYKDGHLQKAKIHAGMISLTMQRK